MRAHEFHESAPRESALCHGAATSLRQALHEPGRRGATSRHEPNDTCPRTAAGPSTRRPRTGSQDRAASGQSSRDPATSADEPATSSKWHADGPATNVATKRPRGRPRSLTSPSRGATRPPRGSISAFDESSTSRATSRPRVVHEPSTSRPRVRATSRPRAGHESDRIGSGRAFSV